MVTDADQGATSKGAVDPSPSLDPPPPAGGPAEPPANSPAPKAGRSAALTALFRTAQVLAGLAVGSGIAEAVMASRDDGAFPHLNVYVTDPELGLRLRPGLSQRIAFGPNPTTSVRINAQGFRGADFPAPGDDEVLVVGDSQVFGLGVEEGETTPAQLAAIMGGKTVLNGGVPTYGPAEYTKVIAEVFEKRHPKTVIYVVNFANDLFEAPRPNKERHKVWDGWAVRPESAPESVTEFPGREYLFRRSHAFYALRRLWYEHGPKGDDVGFVSKRTWREIALAGLVAEDDHERAVAETARLAKKHAEMVKQALKDADAADTEIHVLLGEHVDPTLNQIDSPTSQAFYRSYASPGQIVGFISSGEYDEPVYATAEMIRLGAILREKMETMLREKAKRDPALNEKVERSFKDREDKQAQLTKLASSSAPTARSWSPVAPHIRAAKELCDKHQAKLVVVALPLDVQVSQEEWKKYGVDPIDMSPAALLVSDLMDAAMAVGAVAVDPTEALRAAEPGAFLYGDIHMTPKGHRAFAEHIVKVMNEPPPVPKPGKGFPAGRTRPPRSSEWADKREAQVRGSTVANCETIMINEWLRVVCKMASPSSPRPLGIKVVEGGHGEAFVTAGENESVLLVPVLEGDRFSADFSWSDRTQRLVIDWKSGTQYPKMVFQKPSKNGPSEVSPPLASEPFCGCMKARDKVASCTGLVLAPSGGCARTYGSDCDKLLLCMEGDPDVAPACPAGQANAGTLGGCYALCGEGRPCKEGTCTEWQGGRVCM